MKAIGSLCILAATPAETYRTLEDATRAVTSWQTCMYLFFDAGQTDVGSGTRLPRSPDHCMYLDRYDHRSERIVDAKDRFGLMSRVRRDLKSRIDPQTSLHTLYFVCFVD